ncbi:hypothetical protein [Curtobacterium aurantiacum]|uniref:hypothetical protein n=1 Tax=Curtobacterium aurantiacum TaxID=3236919 RepID=UPI001BDDF5B4|nr:hypothetical protein [Curtobacterium flaccumfaciens]MBT1680984.1 hypothetical protein [Curtobacterium flaccumfaciens pv. flaccumfaciens]
MGSSHDRKAVARRRVLVEALDREVDLRRTFVAARAESLTTKGSILAASASLVTALQSIGSDSPWLGFAIASSALAAVLGLVVLLPRVGAELDLEATEANLWGESDVEALRGLTLAKKKVLEKDERALWWRAILIALGFTALALSLISTALVLLQVLPE